MSEVLPRLRFNLDFMPSSDPERRACTFAILITTLMRHCWFRRRWCRRSSASTGSRSTLDLRSELVRITGEIQVGEIEKHLYDALDEAGFLENDRYRELRAKREAEFARRAGTRGCICRFRISGRPVQLAELLDSRVGGPARAMERAIAIAAPHASPDGGWEAIAPPIRRCRSREEAADKTFIILGTSHYGAPDRFGLTRKHFVTPFGRGPERTRLWSTELEKRSAGRSGWKIIAMPSSTPSSFRWSFCSISTARKCRSCRFSAVRS